MIDDKQFIIGKTRHVRPGWKHLQLKDGFYLSFQEKLRVWSNDTANLVVLGHAWQADPDRGTPISELEKLGAQTEISQGEVFEMEKTWCGRYLLIVNDWVFLDTIGALGVFYSDDHVSSSLNVLCAAENKEVIIPEILHGHDPDFVPGMRTCYEDVKRLLPSQIYNFVTKEVKSRPLLPDGIITADNDEARIDMLERCFVHSLKSMSACLQGWYLWLGLTGGYDSRATLAMMEKAGLDYSIYTCWYKWISAGDVDIPKMLAKRLKREQVFLLPDEKSFSQKKHEDYCTHTAGMSVEIDWQYYSYDQYRPLFAKSDDIVLLRSSIWEIPNDYYSQDCDGGILDFEKIYPAIKDNRFLRESLFEWYDYVINDMANQEISIWNRMLWDLRAGCWISSIEQSYDMMEHIVSIQPCNCRLFLSILMGFDQPDRLAKKHMELIAQRVCPVIGKIPYEYQYKERVKLKTRIHRVLRKVYRQIKN